MSNLCKIPRCPQPPCALCNCCQKELCRFHINEHAKLLFDQLNPLAVEVTALQGKLQAFNVNQASSDAREKLDQWYAEYRQKLDLFYEKKCQEMDQCIERKTSKQNEKIEFLRSKFAHFQHINAVAREDIEYIKSGILQLQNDMKNIEQTYVQIQIRPSPIFDTMLQISETLRPKIDLTSRPPAFKTIDHPEKTYLVLTSNNTFLLMYQGSNLCLVNQHGNIVRETLWPFNVIIDMCWSPALNQFILIDETDLFLVDETITSIDKIHIKTDHKWFSCTCSDTSLFLSTSGLGPSLNEFSLAPKIQFIKNWPSPFTCKTNEQIDRILYTNETIALLITNPSNKSIRIELRFSKTLDFLWGLALNIKCTKQIAFHCCLLSFDEWLIADYENCHLIHITKCGQIKATIKYPVVPYRVNLFNQNILVVLTKTGKAFHQLT